MDVSTPPQPRPDLDTAGFWEATAAGRLALCRCAECGLWLHPPLHECRRCGGKTRFEPVSGRGTIYAYTVVRHPAVPGYLGNLPYVIAIVELDEQVGLRLPTRLVDVDPASVRVGQRVVAEIVALAGGRVSHPGVPRRDPRGRGRRSGRAQSGVIEWRHLWMAFGSSRSRAGLRRRAAHR